MAEIKSFPVVRHLRAEPTSHVLRYHGGDLRAGGAGAAFWFRPINSAVAEVPIDDRELPFLFHARSADFQQLTVQGVITFRIADPGRIARRVDFSIDLDNGRWTQTPLEQVAGLLTQLAQQFVIDELVKLESARSSPTASRRSATGSRMASPPRARSPSSASRSWPSASRRSRRRPSSRRRSSSRRARRSSSRPTRRRSRAGRWPSRRSARSPTTSSRTASSSRAARRSSSPRRVSNARRRAEEDAIAQLVAARADDERVELRAERDARTTDTVQAAMLRAEAERTRIQASVPADVRLALALQDFAGQVGTIQNLTITPDLLSSLLTRVGAGAGNGTA